MTERKEIKRERYLNDRNARGVCVIECVCMCVTMARTGPEDMYLQSPS